MHNHKRVIDIQCPSRFVEQLKKLKIWDGIEVDFTVQQE